MEIDKNRQNDLIWVIDNYRFSISIIDFIENIGFTDKLISYSIYRKENQQKNKKNAKQLRNNFREPFV